MECHQKIISAPKLPHEPRCPLQIAQFSAIWRRLWRCLSSVSRYKRRVWLILSGMAALQSVVAVVLIFGSEHLNTCRHLYLLTYPPPESSPTQKFVSKSKWPTSTSVVVFFFDIPTALNVRLNFWYRVPLSVNTLITSWAFAWWVFVAVRWEVLFFIWSIKFYQNWSPGVIAVYYLQA